MSNAELIEKLERAERPSRELFAEAFRTIFPPVRSADSTVEECEWADLRSFRFFRMLDAEAWESAALMLVPEGWAVRWLRIWPGQQSSCCLAGTHSEHGEQYHDPKDGEAFGRAIAPALALCIAALKAKEADNGEVR